MERFLKWKREETSVGEDWIRRLRWELLRFPELLRRLDPSRPALSSPAAVVPEDIALLRGGLSWEKATFALHFAALRQLLLWSENPIAHSKRVWNLPAGEPSHRRWLSKVQVVRLYRAAQGPARLLVALEGFNGLRRIEVLRLRVRDVLLNEGSLRVLGKGRNGGKWRKVPASPVVGRLVRRAIVDKQPADPLLAFSRSGADRLLQRAVRRSGLERDHVRVSHHDLRRTFGRLAHESGMDLVQLKNLYGHTSLEMTVHYIGLDAEAMRAGLERLQKSLGRL